MGCRPERLPRRESADGPLRLRRVTSPIAAGGLILDAAGALALASAFAFKRPRDVLFEARPYYGPNPSLVLSQSAQTADAWVGGALLFAGFLGQFVDSVGWEPGWACLAWTLPVSGAMAVSSLAALRWVLRPWNERRTIQGTLEAQREIGRADEDWFAHVVWLARTKGREIRAGETGEELAVWLVRDKRWRQLARRGSVPDAMRNPYRPTAQ